MGTRNDDISLILAKAKKQGFLPDVKDEEVDILTEEANSIFGTDVTSLFSTIRGKIPTEVGWDQATFPINPTLTENRNSRFNTGSIGESPESFFNKKSTALSAPGATFYVDPVNGNNANTGTFASQFKSIWKAIDAGNAAGVPTKVIITASNTNVIQRGNGFYGGTNAGPLVDMAFVAYQARVISSVSDAIGTLAADGTRTNCYTNTVAAVLRVIDTTRIDRYGNYLELTNVGSPDICNNTPNSWHWDGTKVWIHRFDGSVVTGANTRYFRNENNLLVSSSVNLYFGGGDSFGYGGFDFEGGTGTGGGVVYLSPTTTTTKKLAVFNNCTFKLGGGIGTGQSDQINGFGMNNWQGAVALFSCQADGNYRDGFNIHLGSTATSTAMLTVNCSARNNGNGPAAISANGHTAHETCISIDIAGDFLDNKGGSIHNINNSRCYLLGSAVTNDLGDIMHGGSIPPTAIKTGDTAVIYAERVKVDMPRGTAAYYAASGSAIYRKDCATSPQPDQGNGTFGTF